MSQRAFVPALVLAVGLSSSSARAEESAQADDPVLDGLIAEVLERSPGLQAARHLLSAALARPDQAASRPGPTLGLLYTNDGWSPSLGREDMTTLSVMGSQELPYPGKRRLRREVAEADADVASQDVERARLSLVSAVKQAYYGLAVARGLASLAGAQRELWKEIQETARVRYASAAGPQQELLRAQVEATRVEALHAQHHAEARARLAELNRLRGRPAATEIETPATVRIVALDEPLEVLQVRTEAISPELKAATAEVARDELAVALAKKGFRPDFNVQGGYMNRGGLDPMWQAGASITLPSRGRARAALAEAEARLAASRARVEDVRLQLHAVVEQRVALLSAAQEIEATYRQGILPQGQTTVEAALARYRAGQSAQLLVLESVVAQLDDRTDYLRLLGGHATERARLEEASLAGVGMDALLMHGRAGAGGSGAMSPSGMKDRLAGAAMAPEMR
jgi:outer membrane protein, heavy metal efflux system